MFKYFPHTPEDIETMLKKIGVADLDSLFDTLPSSIRFNKDYQIPESLSELEVRELLENHAQNSQPLIGFRGAGAYDHYIPSIIKPLISRQEFLTSYTPYQPEVSQGTLQYIFEFQTMICELTGMDVSNASMYDGATATAEALFMAHNITKSKRIIISDLVNLTIREVLSTYAHYRGLELVLLQSIQGRIDRQHLVQLLSEGPASIVVQYPNFYGIIEDMSDVSNLVHQAKGVVIMNANPSLLSVLKKPSDCGADIVCGDAQPLGIPLSFGGPYLGYLTTKTEFVRKMPGRICGITKDVDGKRGFVLTLQAREQHIRRDKANSNICSNQSLMALNAAIYMSTLGKEGLKEVATRSIQGAHYLYKKLIATPYFKTVYNAPFGMEFVLATTLPIAKLEAHLVGKGYLLGLPVEGPSREENLILFAVTEKRKKQEIDSFVHEIEVFANEIL